MKTPLRVLIVEDSDNDTQSVLKELQNGGFQVEHHRVDSAPVLNKALNESTWDAVIANYHHPDCGGMAAIEIVLGSGQDLPIILVADPIGEEAAIDAMRAGAHDCVRKDKLTRLCPALKRALDDAEVRRQRRLAEVALAEREGQFRQVFEQNPIGIYRTTPDGRILMANPALVAMLGCQSLDEVKQRSLEKQEYFPDYPREQFKSVLEQEGQVEGLESTWRRRDGSLLHVRENARVVRDATGEILYYEGTAEDITTRKLAEQALQERERLLSEMSRIAEIGAWEFDALTHEGTWTEEAARIHDLNPLEKITVEYLLNQFQDEARRQMEEAVQAAIADGIPYDLELELFTVIGNHKWIRTIGQPVMRNGRVVQVRGTIQDITERKRADEIVARISREWNVTFNATNDAIWVLDDEHRVMRSNLAAARLLQCRDEEMLGRFCWEIVHGSTEPIPNCPLLKAKHSLSRESMEFKLGEGWFQVTVDPIVNAQGGFAGAVHIVSDITVSKLAAEALAASEVKFRRLFETAKDGILILDAETGIVIDVNPFLLQLMRCESADVIGKELWELGPFKDIAANKTSFHLLQERDYIRYEDLPLETAAGDLLQVEFVSNTYWVNHQKVIQCNIRDITERKLTELALQEGERRLLDAQRKAHIGDWSWDLATDSMYWSAENYRIFGLDPEHVPPSHQAFIGAVAPQDRERVQRSVQQSLSNQQPTDIDFSIIRPDGTSRVINVKAESTFDEQGQPVRLSGTVQDITARKRAEEDVRRASADWELTFDTITDMITVHDAEFNIIRANKAAKELLALPELIKRNELKCYAHYHGTSLPPEGCPSCGSMQTLVPCTQEVFEPHLNRFIEIRAIPTTDENNNLTGMIHVVRDISERKQAEQALADEAIRRRILVEQSSDGIVVLDNDGKVYEANQSYADMLGYSLEEVRHLHVWDWDEQWTREQILEMVRTVDAEGSHFETRHRRKDGSLLDVQISSNGAVCGGQRLVFCVCRDISERKQAEQEREAMLRRQEGISLLQQTLLAPAPLPEKFKQITDSVVQLFDADFCRIWQIQPGDRCEQDCIHAAVLEGPHVCRDRDHCLHLTASSGRYTHLDGEVHRRVPFGCYKIGRVAAGDDHKFVTNDVQSDPRVHDHAWARDLGLVSFAGYQIRVPGGQALGVLALFAKHPLTPAEDALLDGLSSTIAHVIQQAVAEDALRREMERAQQYLDVAGVMFVGLDPEGTIMLLNPKACAVLGYDEQELLGQNWFERCLPPGESAMLRPMHSAIVAGEIDSHNLVENFILTKSGAVRRIAWVNSLVRDAAGRIVGTLSSGEDVTERVQAAQDLLRSETKFRTLYNSSSDAVMLLDEQGFSDCNTAALHMFGCSSKAEFCRQHPSDFSPPVQPNGLDSVTAANQHIAAALAEGSDRFEWIHRRLDTATDFPAEVLLSSMELDGRRVLQAVVRDITIRKRAEEARQASAALLQLVVETTPLRVFWKDKDLKYLGCNNLFARDADLASPSEIIGKSDYEMSWRADAESYRTDDQSVISSGEARLGFEERQLTDDGKIKWLRTSKVPLRDAAGNTIGVLGCYDDITETREAQENLKLSHQELLDAHQQLKQQQEQLLRSEKLASLGQLAAGVAHEINNPIAFIKSNLGTLQDYVRVFKTLIEANQQLAAAIEAGDEAGIASARQRLTELETADDVAYILEDVDGMIQESLEGTERVRDIVSDLRNFAHAGKETAVEADVNQIIESSLRIAWNELKYKCVVKRDLGPLPKLRCYPERLNQVFVNLFVNAAQAIVDQGTIEIATEATDQSIVIRIADNGEGIAPEVVKNIFNPFFTTKEVGQGTGLGLAISHATVQNHGGTIDVTSKLHEGTTFTINLPLQGVSDD